MLAPLVKRAEHPKIRRRVALSKHNFEGNVQLRRRQARKVLVFNPQNGV
jgi:hypothetical protein